MPRRSKRSKRGGASGAGFVRRDPQSGTDQCPQCGNENRPSAVYCATCGHALRPVPSPGWRRLLPLVIIAGGLAAYANSFDKAFVFDDTKQIVNNERLRGLSNLSRVVGGRRPVTDLTLALNYHFHELDVFGYHLVNVTVHILAALTLYGIVRRTLLLESLRGRFGRAAPWIALSVALIWVVHPLQTQSVTYLIQRAESLMGLFYLLTVYCVLRGATSDRRWVWYVAAAVACGLGMGSKAVAVTAPIAVLLYDRVYLAGSLGELFKRRWPLYVMLCATWGVLGTTRVLPQVMSSSKPNATVGFSVKQITPMQYLVTQPDVIRKYLKLSFWPATLCLDYSWDLPVDAETGGVDWSRVALPGAVIVALLTVTVWLLVTRPKVGFVCAWFFLILVPTSSFVPIKDVIFEHRMYLPLAGVVTLTVVVAYILLRDITAGRAAGARVRTAVSACMCAVVVIALGAKTFDRNKDYASRFVMWSDVVSKRPDNPRAYLGIGAEWYNQATAHRPNVNYELVDRSEEAFRKAVTLDPDYGEAWYNLGNSLFEKKAYAASAEAYERSLVCGWTSSSLHYNYANALKKMGRSEEAIDHYGRTLDMDPTHKKAHVNMGNAYMGLGRIDEAIEHYYRALEIDPSHLMAHFNLGAALSQQGRYEAALAAYDRALAVDPNSWKAEDIRQRRSRILKILNSRSGG